MPLIRNFQLGATFAVALSLSILPTAGHAYTQEEQATCQPDAFRLCSSEIPDVDRVTVRYASPLGLLHDLRRMGAANAQIERRRVPLRRATLQRMLDIYAARFADADGRVRATFDMVWLSGWAPHGSQQQPLAPGSARTRLADALHTHEIPAGEKAGG